ncbi:DNA-processing protein DprA [Marmoricola endophyticus]|uniref:DNA-processing protein DprA n=1 Tax=Marmoricola endophyticus TaxID=2040280 RepID=UPI001E4595A4|nr:DNA-processing protein DprA [Marmoricola endophyticus]
MSAGPARRAPDDERLARAALGRLAEPGDPRLTAMVLEEGAVRALATLTAQRRRAAAAAEDAEASRTLVADVAARLAALDPGRDLAEAARIGVRFVVPGDDEWPECLDDLDRCGTHLGRGGRPMGLWARGPLRLDEVVERAPVAVVGSRSSTSYGDDAAGEIAAEVARAGHPVVSGGAFGIDKAAHRGALAVSGQTVAVLANGVDRAYPASHADLLARIAETGLVVSEMPPAATPTKLRFLARNRLIAGLGSATVVVEAATRSGALNTSTWAEMLNRIVMGVPGPVTSATSEGVHELIRGRGGLLVTRGAEVLEAVAPMGQATLPVPRQPQRPEDRLSLHDQQVRDALPAWEPVTAEHIARAAGLSLESVIPALDRLLEAGLSERWEGRYRLRRA